MRKLIQDAILRVPVGMAFDAHFIIDTIIRRCSDDYLRFAEAHPAGNKRTEYVHSQLSKVIADFEGSLIERLDARSFSYNIRGNSTDCTLWRRIA